MASSDTEWDVAGESSGMPVDSLSECADAPAHEKAPGLLPPSGSGLSQQRTTQQQTASPAGSRDAAELVDAVQGLSLQPEGADAACVQGSQTEEEALVPEARHLPDGVVRNIAAYLVSADAQTAFLSLLSLCGTCAQWRAVCSELPSQTPSLAFDSYDNFYTSRPLVQRFRKLSPAAKAEVFEAAATLFSGRARACARIAPGLAACAQGTMNFALEQRLAAWVTCMHAAPCNARRLLGGVLLRRRHNGPGAAAGRRARRAPAGQAQGAWQRRGDRRWAAMHAACCAAPAACAPGGRDAHHVRCVSSCQGGGAGPMAGHHQGFLG